MNNFVKKVTFLGLLLSFVFYPNSVLSYVDGDGEDLVIDAPWRTIRDYLPVLFFTPEFHEDSNRQITNIVLYNYDPVTEDKNLIFRDNRHPIGNTKIEDDFKCEVTFIDANGVTRSHATADDEINDFWHYIARVPTSCIGMGDKQGKPGVHYLRGEFNWGRIGFTNVVGQYLPVKEYKVLRVVVSNEGLAKFSAVDHHYDVHVHTIAEQTKWHGVTNVNAGKKAFGGPMAMLMESAYALGMVGIQLKDANWSDFKNKIVTTDHNAFFSGNPYDAGSSPGTTGPTSKTNGKKGEFQWYRDNLGVLGGEEVTVQGANGKPLESLVDGDIDVDFKELDVDIDIDLNTEVALGSHLLAYGAPHFEGPWHGGQVVKHIDLNATPNKISISNAISKMGSINGFGYAAHPESGGIGWSTEYFDKAIGLWPYNVDTENAVTIQNNKQDFVFKGIQVWNGHADMKSSKSGRIEVGESHHFNPFTPKKTTENFEYNDSWRNGHNKTYSLYKDLLKSGLEYSFKGSQGNKFIRKLYIGGGTDSHGDFNYEMSIFAHHVAELAETFNIDPEIMEANNNAFGRMRTYTLTSQRYIRAGASIPARCPDFPFCKDAKSGIAPSSFPVEDYKEGNTVITDGPIGRFSLDGNCRFNSDYHQLIWHDSFCKWENHDGMIGGRGKFDGGNTLLAPVGNSDVYLNAQWIGKNNYLSDAEGDKGSMKFNFVKINSANDPDSEFFNAGKRHALHLKSLNEVLKSPPTLEFPSKSAVIMEGELSVPENETKFITNPVWIAPYKFSVDAPTSCPMKAGELKIAIEFGLSMDSTLPSSGTSGNVLTHADIQGHTGKVIMTSQDSNSTLDLSPAGSPDTVFEDPEIYQGIRVRLKPLNSQGNSTVLEHVLSDANSVWSASETPVSKDVTKLIQNGKLTLSNSKAIPCSVGGWDSKSRKAHAKVASYAIVVDQIYDMFHNYLNPIATAFSVKKKLSAKDNFEKPKAPETRPILLPESNANLMCSNTDSQTCKSNGASCEILLGTNKSKNSVCRWSAISTEQQCLEAKGIWTKVRSKYARNHPNAVPVGQVGACITESKNLKE